MIMMPKKQRKKNKPRSTIYYASIFDTKSIYYSLALFIMHPLGRRYPIEHKFQYNAG
jgi:hypothetical protein